MPSFSPKDIPPLPDFQPFSFSVLPPSYSSSSFSPLSPAIFLFNIFFEILGGTHPPPVSLFKTGRQLSIHRSIRLSKTIILLDNPGG